ncbi:MAG: TPM domain-containing protein [Bacteroidia bacterium]|nr:TPM domain-containing protein [Bacteroidia bacterium]
MRTNFFIFKSLGLFFFFCTASCFPQQTSKQPVYSAKELSAFRQNFWNSLPEPTGWVNDYDSIFTAKEKKSLDSVIGKFKSETGFEIAVVTLDTLHTVIERFDSLIIHIAEVWGVGEQGKMNGTTIGICKGYRKFRIRTGEDVKNLMPDEQCTLIMNNYFFPEFKKGNYFKGTFNGLVEMVRYLREKIK